MMTEILNVVAKALNGSFGIFFRVVDGLDARDLIFGALAVVTVYRLLLVPILGGRLDLSRNDYMRNSEIRKEREYMKKENEQARKDVE